MQNVKKHQANVNTMETAQYIGLDSVHFSLTLAWIQCACNMIYLLNSERIHEKIYRHSYSSSLPKCAHFFVYALLELSGSFTLTTPVIFHFIF